MTDPNRQSHDDSRPGPAEPPPTLGYRAAAADRGGRSVAQIVGAALLTVLVVAGVIFAAAVTVSSMRAMIGVGALLVVLLIALALWLGRSPARRSLAMGIWIGLGVALLVEGVCWSLIS